MALIAYTLSFTVRDYECDMEGIVNNAVYQNYLEHTRHQFLLSRGIDFAEITSRGVHPVVVRAEIDYRSPLRSGDQFWVGVHVEPMTRFKFAFLQDIYRGRPDEREGDSRGRRSDDRLIAKAKIIAAGSTSEGRPVALEAMHPRLTELVSDR